MAELEDRARAAEDAQRRVLEAEEAAKRARGFRYVATIWIHRDDRDDAFVRRYFRTRPKTTELRAIAAAQKSVVLDDHAVHRIPSR
jgi:hypothetical protein